MRTRRVRTVGAAIAGIGSMVMASVPCNAQNITTGNYWLEMCSMKVASECVAFIQGLDALHAVPGVRQFYCIPDGVTLRQMQSVVLKYLRDNPAKLHAPFVMLALTALREAYPCPKISN